MNIRDLLAGASWVAPGLASALALTLGESAALSFSPRGLVTRASSLEAAEEAAERALISVLRDALGAAAAAAVEAAASPAESRAALAAALAAAPPHVREAAAAPAAWGAGAESQRAAALAYSHRPVDLTGLDCK